MFFFFFFWYNEGLVIIQQKKQLATLVGTLVSCNSFPQALNVLNTRLKQARAPSHLLCTFMSLMLEVDHLGATGI